MALLRRFDGLVVGFGSCHRPFHLVDGRIAPNGAAGIDPRIVSDLRRTADRLDWETSSALV